MSYFWRIPDMIPSTPFRHGSTKTRLKHGAEFVGACNSQCVPEWKHNLMAEYFISHISIGSDEFNKEVENYVNVFSSMIENRQPLENITDDSDNKIIEKIEKGKIIRKSPKKT